MLKRSLDQGHSVTNGRGMWLVLLDLYRDVEDHLELFDDLNKSVDWKNECVLKMHPLIKSESSDAKRVLKAPR